MTWARRRDFQPDWAEHHRLSHKHLLLNLCTSTRQHLDGPVSACTHPRGHLGDHDHPEPPPRTLLDDIAWHLGWYRSMADRT